MENIRLEGTDRLPHVDFDFAANRFAIGGYSFPENVKEFYDPILEPLTRHLDGLKDSEVEIECAFVYFHSSTAQILYTAFDSIDACAARGNLVTVNWHYESGDDGMLEAGEDFAEELEHANLILKETAAP